MFDGRTAAKTHPSLREALGFWWKLGWISFGGTAAHLAIMQSELVEKRRWIDSDHFFHALSHCMLLPGPERSNLRSTLAGSCMEKQAECSLARCLFFPRPSSSLDSVCYTPDTERSGE